MQNSKLQVLFIKTLEGVSKKSGNAYKMHMAQCALHNADGSILVGELPLGKGMENTAPGDYTAGFRLESYQGRLNAVVDTLTPLKPVKA